MLSITHSYFNFKTANEFMVVNKFSSLICSSWNDFYIETDQFFTIALETMSSRSRGCESITVKFEEDSRSILKESLNYIGCKAILGHLLYCNHLIRKQYCFLCTRMISRESNLTEILFQLYSVSLKELLEDASESMSETYDILKCGDRSVFLNCFIDSGKINNSLDFTDNFPILIL